MPATWTRRGRYRLSKAGTPISEHNDEKEAFERAFVHAEDNGPGLYHVDPPRIELDIQLMGSKLTRAIPTQFSAAGSGSASASAAGAGAARVPMAGVAAAVAAVLGVGSFTSGGGGESWQLAAGHYIPSKMAPEIVSPRPDSETQAGDRCRRWVDGLTWHFAVGVRGGARPFKYQVTSGPTGLGFIRETIPSDYWANGHQGYAMLAWANPTLGSHSITVRVTGQDGLFDEVTWTLTIVSKEDASLVMFVDSAAADDSGTGAYSSPKKTHLGYYVARGNSAHAGKLIIFRGGTGGAEKLYPITQMPVIASGQRVIFETGKPHTFAGLVGEKAVIDLENTAYIWWDTHTPGGASYTGLYWRNPRVIENAPNFRKTFVAGSNSALRRFAEFENHWDGGGDTSSNNGSNSSVIMFAGGSSAQYFSCTHSTYHQCDNMDYVLHYLTFDSVFEHNETTGGYDGSFNNGWGVFFKGGSLGRATVAFHRGFNQSIDCPLVHYSEFTNEFKTEIEVCWVSWQNSHASGGRMSGVVGVGQGNGTLPDAYGTFWVYRCNGLIHHHEPTGLSTGTFIWENNAFQYVAGSGINTDGFKFQDCDIPPVVFTVTNQIDGTSGVLDSATNLLIGASRTAGLGTHGCEVA